MRILIFGASGFIGRALLECIAAAGHDPVPLCRSGSIPGHAGRVVAWNMGAGIDAGLAEGVDCAIHLAHDFSGEEGARRTFEGTVATVRSLAAARVPRQQYVSSYSAGPHASSLYGRTKHALEIALAGTPGMTIVRPGLVLGPGGLFARISKWANRLPVVPLPDGGRGQVPVIGIDALCREMLALAQDGDPPAERNLFEPRLKSLREIVEEAAGGRSRPPLILPVPSALLRALLALGAMLRLPLPVNADNLDGFLANQGAQHASDIR